MVKSTRGCALNRVHNSRRACSAVSLSSDTAQRDCTARLSRCDFFCTFDPVTLTLDLILIGRRGIMIYCPCAMFGDFIFSRSSYIIRTDRQNHRSR